MASTQQKKLLALLMDLTGTSYGQLHEEMSLPIWKLKRPSRKMASSMIAYLVRVADRQGVPMYKYRPAPVKKYRKDDDGA